MIPRFLGLVNRKKQRIRSLEQQLQRWEEVGDTSGEESGRDAESESEDANDQLLASAGGAVAVEGHHNEQQPLALNPPNSTCGNFPDPIATHGKNSLADDVSEEDLLDLL